MRFAAQQIAEVLRGTDAMKESSVYQDFVHKGELRTAREFVLTAGTERFGEPEPAVRSRIQSISDLEWLREAFRRALKVSSWEELLADVPEPTESDSEA